MNATLENLDAFTRAYIEAALWSSSEYQFGECPCCGKQAILSHYPEAEFEQVPMCAAEGCGVKEIANPDPMDDHYGIADLAPETLDRIVADCAKFQADHGTPDYNDSRYSDAEKAGHDFWLTRNGHGTGFWDRDLGEDGDRFTAYAKAFGDVDLYVGDDGKLYLA